MRKRKLVQQALLRRALRKELRSSNEKNEPYLQLALDDEAVFETLYDQSMHNAKQFGASTNAFSISSAGDGSPVVDNLLKLLQWFVTNGPLLIELIQQIVGLFGSIATATEICEAETLFIE